MRSVKKDALLQIRMTSDMKQQLQNLAVEYGIPMTSLVIYAIAQFILEPRIGEARRRGRDPG